MVEPFKKPILNQYEAQGSPYYSTARLWDDGIIDPKNTRNYLARGLKIIKGAPNVISRFGMFRT